MTISKVLLFSSSLALADAGALRTKSAEAIDCSLLSEVKVDDYERFPDIGPIAQILCTFWPEDDLGFGFPLTEVNQVEDLLNRIASAPGVWDQFDSDVADQEKADSMFCVRRQAERPLLEPTGSSCPSVVNEEEAEEIAGTDPNSPLLQGSWVCTDAEGDTCECVQHDDPNHPTAEINPRPEGCELVHAGVCYGPCPQGYQKTPLLGKFRPVCTSVCGSTHHRFGCGVGCASSRVNCAIITIKQVRGVAAHVARAHAFVTQNLTAGGIGDLADALNFVVEWATTKLHTWVNDVIQKFEDLTRPDQMLTTALALFAYIQTLGLQDGLTHDELKDLIMGSLNFVLNLLDINIGFEEIDMHWLENILIRRGGDALIQVAKTLAGFNWKSCEIAPTIVSFTIEEAGDSRVVGQWLKKANRDGKPTYVLDGSDSTTLLEWNQRDAAWKMFVKNSHAFGWLGLGWKELYRSTRDSVAWPTVDWQRVEGVSPIPVLMSVE